MLPWEVIWARDVTNWESESIFEIYCFPLGICPGEISGGMSGGIVWEKCFGEILLLSEYVCADKSWWIYVMYYFWGNV